MPSRRDFLLSAGAVAALSAGCGSTRPGSAIQPIDVPGAAAWDWPIGTPQSQGMNAAALARTLDAGTDLRALRSLLVVRNGVLVAERYYGSGTADDLFGVQSVTKSVSSVLVGQAIGAGKIASVSATVRELLPEAAARAPDAPAARLTLAQILTGRTGLRYDWSTDSRALATAADPVRHALDLPADQPAGSAWSYNDAAVHLLSPILQRAQGIDIAALAARDLFAPLGIRRYAWPRDRAGQPLAYGGLQLRTRDLVKLPWTMLDGGRWQGRQVIPASWVAESLRSHGPASWQAPPIVDTGYGYLWFTGALAGRPVMWGWGYGGQFALLAPSLRLAVATAATPPPIAELASQTQAMAALVARMVQAAA